MVKIYKFALALIAMLNLSVVFSQVTVDATQGTATGSYGSLGQAVAAINNGTFRGNIRVRVHRNTLESAGVTLVASGTGSASYTKILITPADTATVPKVITLNGSIGGIVTTLTLDGADNVTIDGRPNQTGTQRLLTLINPHPRAQCYTLQLLNAAQSDTIRYCTTINTTPSQLGSGNIRLGAGANINFGVYNNWVEGGGFGVDLLGSSDIYSDNLAVVGNMFLNQTSSGVRFQSGGGSSLIDSNTITHTIVIQNAANFLGIAIQSMPADKTITITRNRIYNIQTTGTIVYAISNNSTGAVIMRNNSIVLMSSNIPNSFVRGIAFAGSTTSSMIVENNTIRIGGPITFNNNNPLSACIQKSFGSATTRFVCRNNLLINTRSGYGNTHVALQLNDFVGNNTIDYNTYYSTTTNKMARGTGNSAVYYTSFEDYKTAAGTLDEHSVFGNVLFADDTSPDFTTGNSAPLVYGTELSHITTDINGTQRTSARFFKGAYQGNPSLHVLPVKLTAFDASMNGKNVLLSWTTASETNNEGFEILRSEDGVNFSKIGWVKADPAPSVTRRYSFTDFQPFEGKNLRSLYYRLKQVDINGQFELHRIRSVDVSPERRTIAVLAPNPVVSTSYLDVTALRSQAIRIKVLDAAGRQVNLLSKDLVAGKNRISLPELLQLNKGIFYLSFEIDGVSQDLRFVR